MQAHQQQTAIPGATWRKRYTQRCYFVMSHAGKPLAREGRSPRAGPLRLSGWERASAPNRQRPPLRSNQIGGGDGVLMTLKQACSTTRRRWSAICVQEFDDSLNPAIHITFRISLRSSSLREPRYPLLKVVFGCVLGSKRK